LLCILHLVIINISIANRERTVMRLSKIIFLMLTLSLSVTGFANLYFDMEPSPVQQFPAQVPFDQVHYEDVIIGEAADNRNDDSVTVNFYKDMLDPHVTIVDPASFKPLAGEPVNCIDGQTVLGQKDKCTIRIALQSGGSAGSVPTANPLETGGLLVLCNVPGVRTTCDMMTGPVVNVVDTTGTTLSVDPIALIPGQQASVEVHNSGTVAATNVVAALPGVLTGHISAQTNTCATIPASGDCVMHFTLVPNSPLITPADNQVVNFHADNTPGLDVPVTTGAIHVTVSSQLSFAKPGVQAIEVTNSGSEAAQGLTIGKFDSRVHNVAAGGGSSQVCGSSVGANSSCNFYFTAADNAYLADDSSGEASTIPVSYTALDGSTKTVDVPVSIAKSSIAFAPTSITGETSGSFEVDNKGPFNWINPMVAADQPDWLKLTADSQKGCTNPVAIGQACHMQYTMATPHGLSAVIRATGINTNIAAADFNPDHDFMMAVEKGSDYQHYQYASVYVKNLTNVPVALNSVTADITSGDLNGEVLNCDQTGANCDPAVIGVDVCKSGSALAANNGECHIWYKVQTLLPSGGGDVPVTIEGTPSGGASKTLAQTFHIAFKNSIVAGGQSNGTTEKVGDGFLDIWNGKAWEPIGPAGAFDGSVDSLALYQGSLYVGGEFSTVGAVENTNLIARWDSKAWHAVNQGLLSNQSDVPIVNTLYVDNTSHLLYAGGYFNGAKGQSIELGDVTYWDGVKWNTMQQGVHRGFVKAITKFKDHIIVGGNFEYLSDAPANGLASWDPKSQTWVAIPFVPNAKQNDYNQIYALAANTNSLYIGGQFTVKVGTDNVMNIMSWDGTKLIPLVGTVTTGSASSPVNSLMMDGSAVYIGGGGFKIGTTLYDNLSKYADGKFNNIGTLIDSPQGRVNAISLDASSVYIGQSKSTTSQSYAMQWNGKQWVSLGKGDSSEGSLPGTVNAEILLPQIAIN
jgi:hypothetical protein